MFRAILLVGLIVGGVQGGIAAVDSIEGSMNTTTAAVEEYTE